MIPSLWGASRYNINKIALIFFLFDYEHFKKNIQKKGWRLCHPFKLFSKSTDLWIDSFYQPLQRASGAEFHKLGNSVGYHLAHGLGP